MADVNEAIIGMVGVIVGGAITTWGTIVAQRQQIKATLAAEERVREISASTTVLNALSQLLQLPDEPDMSDDEWHHRRQDLLFLLDTASQDLRSKDLRSRLAEAHDMMERHAVAARLTGQSEARTRSIACVHAVACLGAFRRGEPLPDRPDAYTQTIDAIDEWTTRTGSGTR
jgi:hypothetical protein